MYMQLTMILVWITIVGFLVWWFATTPAAETTREVFWICRFVSIEERDRNEPGYAFFVGPFDTGSQADEFGLALEANSADLLYMGNELVGPPEELVEEFQTEGRPVTS